MDVLSFGLAAIVAGVEEHTVIDLPDSSGRLQWRGELSRRARSTPTTSGNGGFVSANYGCMYFNTAAQPSQYNPVDPANLFSTAGGPYSIGLRGRNMAAALRSLRKSCLTGHPLFARDTACCSHLPTLGQTSH